MRALLVVLLLASGPGRAEGPSMAPDGGRGFDGAAFSDTLSPQLEAQLRADQQRNVAALQARGLLQGRTPAITGLIWPLAPTPGVGDRYTGISNFVDLNASFPNLLLDYQCGARTYDTTGGYNHGGADIFSWPFAWSLMDTGAIAVRAAGAGTIVAKVDGRDDRSCSFNAPDTPNYVFVQHADGTVAWYLHLRNGSTTTRPVGASVVAGDYLGQMGSSGVSTGPHLHFELHAPANGPVIESFNGACNAAPTAWAAQRPYYDSRINRLATHLQPPVFPTCPNTIDQPNLANRVAPGANVHFAAYYRDQRHAQVTQFRLLRPDQSTYQQWSFDSQSVGGSAAHYAASYWYFTRSIPAAGPQGTWTFEATFEGQVSTHQFQVVDGNLADGFENPLL